MFKPHLGNGSATWTRKTRSLAVGSIVAYPEVFRLALAWSETEACDARKGVLNPVPTRRSPISS